MKRFLWLLLAAPLAFVLLGCQNLSTTRYKYVSEPLPDALIQDCGVTAPPAKEQYTSSTWEQKEALLSHSLQGTYKDLTHCNGDKKALREWKAKQERLKAEREGKPAH